MDDRSAQSARVSAPATEEQIIASAVGAAQPLNSTIYLAAYDTAWPAIFTQLAQQIHAALESAVLLLEHVGSTSIFAGVTSAAGHPTALKHGHCAKTWPHPKPSHD